METPVGEEREARAKQEGMEDAVEDPGLCHSSTYLNDRRVELPGKLVAKSNGMCLKEVADSSLNGAVTTSNSCVAEDADDGIVDFLDKNNDEVYLPLSHH
jgi:hypothetical protein